MRSAPLALRIVLATSLVACGRPTDVSTEALVETELASGASAIDGEDEGVLDGLASVPPRYLDAEPPVLLDRRDDGATLIGRPEPALADSDPERVLSLDADRNGRPIDASLDGARVLDARFAGETVVVLGTDHVLRAHVHGRVTTLDEGVEAPLSVVGTVVAYARGEMPSFELARADVTTGVARVLTEGMAPVWSPALSPDGDEIVFVSGATGGPRLCRIDANGHVETLPDVGAFPSSLTAPVWTLDGMLAFDGERGDSHHLDLATGALDP